MNDNNPVMTEAMDRAAGEWLSGGAEVLWQSERLFDGSFLQRHVLAVEPDSGEVTVLRGWMSGPQEKPAVSVDMSLPYERFSGELDEETFPHSPDTGRKALSSKMDPLEMAFRAHLLGEHVEIVWASVPDATHAAFIARSAKVNRDDHIIAGTVDSRDGSFTVDIGFRQELASLKPAVRRAMAR